MSSRLLGTRLPSPSPRGGLRDGENLGKLLTVGNIVMSGKKNTEVHFLTQTRSGAAAESAEGG